MHKRLLILAVILLFLFPLSIRTSATELLAQDEAKEEEALFVAKKAYEDGFYEVSLSLLERFLKNYPASVKSAEAHLLIGQCYFHQNRSQEALQKFQELLKRKSAKEYEDALTYWSAEVYFKINDFSTAQEYYRRIITEFSDSKYSAAAYYSLGWCLFQGQDYAEALKNFKVVEEDFPGAQQAEDASFKILECLYNIKDYEALKQRLSSSLKAYSGDIHRQAYLYFYLAEAEYYLNDFEQAIKGYSKVISTVTDSNIKGLSQLGVGWSYLKLNSFDRAEEAFAEIDQAKLERVSLDVLLLGQAVLMFETQRFEESAGIYERLLDLTQDPDVAIQAYLGKADSYYNLAKFSLAKETYREALERGRDSIAQESLDKLHYGLAWSHLKEGEFKEAISEFKKIVRETDDKTVKVSTLCHIGDTYQDLGDFDSARESYDRILEDYPDSLYSDYVQYQLGVTLLKSANYSGAAIAFATLKSNFPDSKLLDDASYAQGLAYFQKEDYAYARDILERFQVEFTESNLRPQAMYL
ncbi:tetratricopeptide repeat protein, partial [Candidatus Omnitrophota bacterium]